MYINSLTLKKIYAREIVVISLFNLRNGRVIFSEEMTRFSRFVINIDGAGYNFTYK